MPGIARSRTVAIPSFRTGGCGSLGGGCTFNPFSGNLLLPISPPTGDAAFLPPVLSYNSTNGSSSTEVGNGWTHTFRRQILTAGEGDINLITGEGQTIYYTVNIFTGGWCIPATGPGGIAAVNALYSQPHFAGFTETAPDGTVYQYGAAAFGPGPLLSIQNAAGAVWSVTYDSNQRVSSIKDPFSRLTTLNYYPGSEDPHSGAYEPDAPASGSRRKPSIHSLARRDRPGKQLLLSHHRHGR